MASISLQKYHAALNDCWKMFRSVCDNKQPIEWAVLEGGRIVQEYESNKMIKDIVFAMWKELDKVDEARRAKE